MGEEGRWDERVCVCHSAGALVLPAQLFCAQQGPGTLTHPAEGWGAGDKAE